MTQLKWITGLRLFLAMFSFSQEQAQAQGICRCRNLDTVDKVEVAAHY